MSLQGTLMLFIGSLIAAMVDPFFLIAAVAAFDDDDEKNDVLDRMLDETRYPAFY
jgi:hypothetical protein